MIHPDYDFKGQLKYETFYFFFRRHWVSFLQPIFFFVPTIVLIFIILFFIGNLILLFDIDPLRVVYGYFVMTLTITFIFLFFLSLINFYFDLVLITDCRVVINRKTVFLKNDYDAIDLTKIQDIAVESRGIIRNYLGYGKLIITLSTSSPPVVLVGVPNPHYLLERINRIKRKHIISRQQQRTEVPIPPESIERKREDYLQDVNELSNL